jgi:hypothetical protein
MTGGRTVGDSMARQQERLLMGALRAINEGYNTRVRGIAY